MKGAYAKTGGDGIVKLFVFIVGMNRVIHFAIPYNQRLIRLAKTVPRARWNAKRRLWSAPEGRAAWLALEAAGLLERVVGLEEAAGDKHCGGPLRPESKSVAVPKPRTKPRSTRKSPRERTSTARAQEVEREQTDLRQALMREGAAYKTVTAYVGIIRQLQAWWGRPLHEAHREDLLAYMTHCIDEKNYSRSTMNQVVNGVRAYYERTLGWTEDRLKLPRPRRRQALPNVCTEADARRMLRGSANWKHRAMLAMIYALGLRKGELLALRVGEVNLERGTVHVTSGKGNKDRILPIPASLRLLLESYVREYDPEHWFFEGQYGAQYSETSIQRVFTRAKEHSGLPPHLTLHGLRHSYATLLKSEAPAPHSLVVENGTPLHVLKDLLGHANIVTTQIYLHTSSKQLEGLYDPMCEL